MIISEGDSVLEAEAVKAAAAEIINDIDELDAERIDLETERDHDLDPDDEDYQDDYDKLETKIDDFSQQAEELREENQDLLEFAECLENWSITGGLISDDHFEEYAQDNAGNIYGVDLNEWPFSHINWEAAADSLRADYSVVTFGDTTYLYRS